MSKIYINLGNQHPLNDLYAVLSVDENGEGIVSALTPEGYVPFVCGDSRILEFFKKKAHQMSKDTGEKFFLVRFARAEIIEVIDTAN